MDPQKTVTVLLAFGGWLAAGLAGCSDEVRGADGWSLEDRGSADVEPAPDASRPDVGEEVGRPVRPDSSALPDSPPTDTSGPGEDGGRSADIPGWYRQRGKGAKFIPESRAGVRFAEADGQRCSERISIKSLGPDVPLYPNGMPAGEALAVFTDSPEEAGSVGFVRTTGTVRAREPGAGPPDYPRELDVEQATLEACTTFETFGECVVPRRDDRCFPDLSGILDGHLKEWSLEPGVRLHGPRNMTTYTLTATFDNPNAADEETELSLSFQIPLTPGEEYDGPGYFLYEVGYQRNMILEFQLRSLAWGQTTAFENNLDGWIRIESPYHFGGAPGTFKINLSGKSSDEDRFRVFGTFEASKPGRD